MLKNLTVYSSNGFKLNKNVIHKIISYLKKEVGFSIDSLQFNFVYSEEIHQINKEYLNHDYSTDIITFNYSGEIDNLEGEIFISIDDALENSKLFKVTLDNEIVRLVVHGLLHLLGYDDIKPSDKKKMKKEEDRLVTLTSQIIKETITVYGN